MSNPERGSPISLLPFAVAMAGPVYLLVATSWTAWFPLAFWTPILVALLLVMSQGHFSRGARMSVAVVSLPILVLTTFEGGLYLIPGDLAWLLILVMDQRD
jgi:hypothetical protein